MFYQQFKRRFLTEKIVDKQTFKSIKSHLKQETRTGVLQLASEIGLSGCSEAVRSFPLIQMVSEEIKSTQPNRIYERLEMQFRAAK